MKPASYVLIAALSVILVVTPWRVYQTGSNGKPIGDTIRFTTIVTPPENEQGRYATRKIAFDIVILWLLVVGCTAVVLKNRP